jgi:MFS superfamily sulfate permease-like transporter
VTANRYDVRELGGAFGDLGTFVPFVLGYLTVTGLDPAGVLVPFGLAQIAVGLRHRTPLAVQPMKAVGSATISQAGTITAGAVQVAGLFTAALWLALALTGAADRLASLVGRPVVQGLILGLGLALALEGIRLTAGDPALGALAAIVAVVLLSRAAAAAMLVLLALGLVVALARQPGLPEALVAGAGWRLPLPGPADVRWSDVMNGVVVLGLPQAALTFGNAVLATAEENNTVFPDRRVTVRRLALNHGLMNLVSAPLGGVPMCHGAGGMAAHVRFGARTGGALVILGTLTLAAGLGFADSIDALMRALPAGVLGVVLLLAGIELASVVSPNGAAREEQYVTLATAGLALWNTGLGFAVGLVLWHATRRGWLRL